MRGEKEKAIVELAVFEEFAEKASLDLVAGSAAKTNPDEGKPDIFCKLKEGVVYFELAEACAPEFAKAFAQASKKPEESIVVSGDDVSNKTVRNKLRKGYSISEPVELLLYTAGRTALPDDVIIARLEPVLSNGLGQFRRIWLLGNNVHELANKSS